VAWARHRLDPHSPHGFWLTFTIAVGALAAWAFGGLTQDVTGHDDTVLADPHVTAWVLAHRTGWLTSALQVLTWLGSTAVIIPAGLAVGLYFAIRRRDWRPLALLGAAVAGAVGLYDIVKALVGRPRPPAAIWIGHYTGAEFPSGHATQSTAFYAMLAIVLGAGLSIRRRAILWGAAALLVLVVGASRIYLGTAADPVAEPRGARGCASGADSRENWRSNRHNKIPSRRRHTCPRKDLAAAQPRAALPTLSVTPRLRTDSEANGPHTKTKVTTERG